MFVQVAGGMTMDHATYARLFKETAMSKLTKDELEEMKAIGYIEGNSATVPDALKVGQELRDKIVAHEVDLAKKHAPKGDAEEPAKPAHTGKRK